MSQGIDVSHHNGNIDWSQVAGAGIVFAYIKASQGAGFTDPMFGTNLAGAQAAGLQHGVYHFLTPNDQTSDQATLFLNVINNQVGPLPPAMDVEPTFATRGGPDLWAEIPLGERVQKIINFATAVQTATGVVPLLYISPSYVNDMFGNDPGLAAYGLWVAEYGVSAPRIPAPFTDYKIWQYSESGSVDGAGSGTVDLDVWNGAVGS